jgi:Common central domain of tyrosinase/Polyphenol oxidase middle domain
MARSPRSRRAFLKTTAAAAAGITILSTDEVFAIVQNGVFIRQSLSTLGPNSPDVVSLRNGISRMRALPATDCRNWNNWGNVHGIGPAPPPTSPASPQWNTCQHGSWWFLPWHRMYLIFFERIIRLLSGNASFSLPYWDYTAGTAAGNVYPARALPLIFRQPTTGNPLFNSVRNATINAGGQMSTSTVSTTAAMASTVFAGPTGSSNSFGSQQLSAPNHGASPHGLLETTPHDAVHVAIGGWMGSFGTAARDPIFWMHHCNIDRLWNAWLLQGGGRRNPTSTTWCNATWRFCNENGQVVGIRVRDVINAQQQLNYRYAGQAAVPLQSCPTSATTTPILALNIAQKTIVAEEKPTTLGPGPVRVPIRVSAKRDVLRAAATSTTRTLALRIEGIQVDAPPGVIYEVYLGLPEGQKGDPTRPEFIGVIAPFGADHAGTQGLTAAFPIDAAAARALQSNPENVHLTFVPRGITVNNVERVDITGRVRFARVRVIEE